MLNWLVSQLQFIGIRNVWNNFVHKHFSYLGYLNSRAILGILHLHCLVSYQVGTYKRIIFLCKKSNRERVKRAQEQFSHLKASKQMSVKCEILSCAKAVETFHWCFYRKGQHGDRHWQRPLSFLCDGRGYWKICSGKISCIPLEAFTTSWCIFWGPLKKYLVELVYYYNFRLCMKKRASNSSWTLARKSSWQMMKANWPELLLAVRPSLLMSVCSESVLRRRRPFW